MVVEGPLLYAGVFLLGLLIGSFLNVVIHRLPARLQHDWECQCRELLAQEPVITDTPPPGIAYPPSRCPQCGHQIRAWENIPLLSYLLLRGRCSNCGTGISLRYPIVELLTGLAFLLVAITFGAGPQLLAGLLFTAFLMAMSGIDLDTQLLPDQLTLPLLWLGLLLSLFGIFTNPVDSILGATLGYGILWGVYHLFRLLTGKEGMGYGDFKLLAALGAWLGWQFVPMIILMSSLVGALVGGALMLSKALQREQPMPFGPFLAAAGWLTLLWGRDLLDWYFRVSGLT